MEPLDENIQDVRETDIALGESVHPFLLLPSQVQETRNTERRESNSHYYYTHSPSPGHCTTVVTCTLETSIMASLSCVDFCWGGGHYSANIMYTNYTPHTMCTIGFTKITQIFFAVLYTSCTCIYACT